MRLVVEGKFGEMVSYQPPHITSVPIADAVNRLSQVDHDCSAVCAARALGVSFGDTAELTSPLASAWKASCMTVAECGEASAPAIG
jgi:6-phosphofructokinase 1